MQGATLGFAEEAQAGIAALTAKATDLVQSKIMGNPSVLKDRTIGQLYDEAVNELRGEQAAFAKEHPITATAATVAGGLATGRGMLGLTKAVGIPATGLRGVTATGTAFGGVAGAGTAEEGGRIAGAAGGAALGAGFGLTVSGISTLGGTVWHTIVPGVKNRLQNIAEVSGLTPAQIRTRLSALGPKATLADVADVFQRAGDYAAGRLGPTARRVQELIRRDETQFSRLIEPIRRTLGSAGNAVRTVSDLKTIRETQASPLYEKAFAKPLTPTQTLMDLLRRDETQKAWRRVQSIGRSDPEIDVTKLGKGDPSFRGWQAITEQLWDRSSTLARSGQNRSAGVIRRLRNAILKELDDQSPDEFAKARALWAGTKQADDMMEAGGQFFKQNADQIKAAMRDMTASDKEFYRLGIGQAIERKMEQMADTADLSRVFRNKAFRDKVFAVFPEKEAAVDFLNTIRAEAIKKTTTNLVGRGAQTQPRQAVEKQLGGRAIGTEDVSKSGIVRRAISAVTGGPREKTVQELGELLLSQDPATQARALKMLETASREAGKGMTIGPTGALKSMTIGPTGAGLANIGGQTPLRRRTR